VLADAFLKRPPLLETVLADARAWVDFRHVNAAATLAVQTHEGRPVLIVERARGADLASLLTSRGAFDTRTSLRIARDLAMALAIAHEAGLYVGDLRPALVQFDEGAGAVLTGLGMARASCLAARFGRHGLPFGHPVYLAPEILQEGGATSPTAVADVYALGILFYELVTGRPPFQGEVSKILEQHIEAPLPPPPSGTEISPKLGQWMLAMTAKDPTQRIQDGKAVANSLYELIGRPLPFPPTERPSRRFRHESLFGLLEDMANAEEGDWSDEETQLEPPPTPTPAQKEAASAERRESTKLRFGRQLGHGTVGDSYEAELWGHDRPIVVKMINPALVSRPELLQRILEDVRKGIAVEGPEWVRTLRAVRVDGRDVILSERAQGRTLRQLIRQDGSVPAPLMLNWTVSLAKALAVALEHGLSHGDIRPEKIYVSREGAQLADLGLADGSCFTSGYHDLGMCFGHPTYLAPEVVQEQREVPNFASDIYAIGIVLYEGITGQPPFQGVTPKQTLQLHLGGSTPPSPALTGPLRDLITLLTSRSPQLRPNSPDALLHAVERCRKQEELNSNLGFVETSDQFDPTDSSELPALPEWSKKAKRTARISRSWSSDRLKKLPPVGPEEWKPDEE
jgi:serine/threonine protein kinase